VSATEISKAISSTKVTGMFLSNQCRKVAEQRLPDRFLRGDFGQFFGSPRWREAATRHSRNQPPMPSKIR